MTEDEDLDDLDNKFNNLVAEFSANQEQFRAELNEIDSKIRDLEKQKQQISEKYSLPLSNDSYHTYIPAKFLDAFEPFIEGDGDYLDELIYVFNMNYNLNEVICNYGKLSSGMNGWEPSSC